MSATVLEDPATSLKRVSVGYVDTSGRVVPLGDARREGRRPDVAVVFPTAHDLYAEIGRRTVR